MGLLSRLVNSDLWNILGAIIILSLLGFVVYSWRKSSQEQPPEVLLGNVVHDETIQIRRVIQ